MHYRIFAQHAAEDGKQDGAAWPNRLTVYSQRSDDHPRGTT